MQTAVNFVNSVKETYGDKAHIVMEQQARINFQQNQHIAIETMTFGLVSFQPEYMHEFKQAGGDVDYLNYLNNAFLNVRSKLYGL